MSAGRWVEVAGVSRDSLGDLLIPGVGEGDYAARAGANGRAMWIVPMGVAGVRGV